MAVSMGQAWTRIHIGSYTGSHTVVVIYSLFAILFQEARCTEAPEQIVDQTHRWIDGMNSLPVIGRSRDQR